MYHGRLLTEFPENGEFVIESRLFGSPYWYSFYFFPRLLTTKDRIIHFAIKSRRMSPERITQDKHLHVLPAVPNALGRLAQLRTEATVDILEENLIGRGCGVCGVCVCFNFFIIQGVSSHTRGNY